MEIDYAPSFPPVQHERAATASVITSTLKCRHIDGHYGIVAPFPTSCRRDVHGIFLLMYSHLVRCMHACGFMRSPCTYCLCLAHRMSFSTRAPIQSLITANQRRTRKTQLCGGHSGQRKPVFHFTEWAE